MKSRRSGGDLEDHPAAADDGANGTAVAVEVRSAVDISRRISDQTRYGKCPSAPPVKLYNTFSLRGGRQFVWDDCKILSAGDNMRRCMKLRFNRIVS
jgi:hypothetical protein